jgi:signal transduction histidine kinase/DNA-binding response OmpR family regulator
LLGISSMVLQGEHFRHILGLGETAAHRELADKLYAELKKKLDAEAGETESRPSVVRLESGTRVFAVGLSPLIAGVGQMAGLVAAMRDISREAEVERMKNEFISTVSHELRTPMTSIKGFTDLLFLGMAGGLTDTQRSFLQIIKSNVDRLTALVNDILDISRIETGRLRLTIESLDLGRIVSQVVTTFQAQYDNRGLALIWDEPQGVPRVRGDEARITQILTNLIANAWQYTPSGGQVTVTLGLARDLAGYLQVDVADNGIGISSDDLARVFDRFYRADTPAVQEVGGSGLGLSIVKMFVEMLGGKIWVDSELGKGSVFHFTMPEVTAEMPEEVTSADLLTTEPTVLAARRPKILVVEDDRDVALLLRHQLEAEGYNVLLAGSGRDALWLAREEQPELITLDIMLPDIDGFLVLEQLKDHPITAPIPVVIISMLGEAEKGYALGAVDYVVKPFSEEQLLDSVRQALGPARKENGSELAPRSLLVVDDEPDIVTFLEQVLSAHGYQVGSAPNGHEALERTKELMPDLILLDLKMPGMDGYEVIRHLKGDEATRGIPIIVITASPVDKERDRVRVLGMGVTQYMAKPLSIETIVAEIKKATMER